MGPEGIEPPPTGLKGRHAAATPRPRSGNLVPGYSFGPDHRLGPRYEFCQRVRAAGFEPAVSSPPSLRIGQAIPRPDRSRDPCGSRTHLSALKERYPPPIDERAKFQEWAGGHSNPRLPGFNRPLDRLSYRPVPRFQRKGPVDCGHTGPETPREGCPWPGVTSARDRARAGSPTDRRIASSLGNPGCDADSGRTWTTSVQVTSQANSISGRLLVSTRVLASLQTWHFRRKFAHFRE
jgi:hypothetical protein